MVMEWLWCDRGVVGMVAMVAVVGVVEVVRGECPVIPPATCAI